MSGLALSKYITDWDNRTTDDGTYAVSTEKLAATCTAGEGTGRSYALKYVPVTGGESVTFTFMARSISGVGKGSIDYPFLANKAQDQIDIVGDWREYQVSTAIPYYHNDATRYVTCTCGVINADAGQVQIADLRISVEKGSHNPLNCVASALIALTHVNSEVVPTINDNFHYCGITDLDFSRFDTLTVTIPNTAPLPSSNMRPIFFAQLTTEHMTGVHLKVGEYDAELGTLDIKFVKDNVFIIPFNEMSDGQKVYISFMAVGI